MDNPYKYWLINQLDLVSDINKLICHIQVWYERIFKLPEVEQFKDVKYINNEGVVFRKIAFDCFNPQQHHHDHKEAILKLDSGQIIRVEFCYADPVDFYYIIDYKASSILKLIIIKQHYELKKRHDGIFVYVIDPTFIAI